LADLPDYTRYIALNVDIPAAQQPAGDPGKYQSSPVDVSDGSRTPLLTDVKGRPIVVLYQGAAETNVIQVKPGRYLASPPDLTDTDRISLLTDIKGRVIAKIYQGTQVSEILQVTVRPKGGILAKGSVTSTSSYATVATRTVTTGMSFQVSKILVSASKAAWVKYRWNAVDISAERLLDDKTIMIEHFPWDYYAMAGDGAKAFDVQTKYDSEAGTINVEIVGEEVTT